MDKAKMSDVATNEADLWLMDGGLPNDSSLIEGFDVPREVENAIETYFLESFGKDKVQSAA